MKTYQEMTLAERQAEYAALCRTHQEQKALGLDLNMARGKPGREQLDMVMEMYNIPLTADDFITDGIDARNYGYVAGIPIARRLFAALLGCTGSLPAHGFFMQRGPFWNFQRILRRGRRRYWGTALRSCIPTPRRSLPAV